MLGSLILCNMGLTPRKYLETNIFFLFKQISRSRYGLKRLKSHDLTKKKFPEACTMPFKEDF